MEGIGILESYFYAPDNYPNREGVSNAKTTETGRGRPVLVEPEIRRDVQEVRGEARQGCAGFLLPQW